MTPYEVKTVVDLRTKGVSYEKIAHLLGRDPKTVMRAANGVFPPVGPFWTVKKTQELRDLLAVCKVQDLSASDMARKLGCSRNAVIGKAHRMGVDLRNGNDGGHRAKGKPHQRRSKAVLKPIVQNEVVLQLPEEPTAATWVRLVDTNDKQCRWPVSDPTHDMLCCGDERAHDGTRYCWHHYRISVSRPERMEDEYS